MGSFGDAIREARNKKEWTEERLAEIVGRKQATISQYELGRRGPGTKTFAKLCEALDLDSSKLHGLLLRDVIEDRIGPDYRELNNVNTEDDEQIPIIGHIAEGPARISWLDETTPARIGDESVSPYIELRDKNAFAIRMKGDSMSPVLQDGDIAIISPKATVRSGNEALVHCRRGHSYLKAVFPMKSVTILRSYNPNYEDIVLENSEIVRTMRVVDIRRKP